MNGASALTEAVATAAYVERRASLDGENSPAVIEARAQKFEAAAAAMKGGVALSEVAAAEAGGHERLLGELETETSRRVKRAAERVRADEKALHREAQRAARLGLSWRSIAESAGVSHATAKGWCELRSNGATPTGSA